MRKNNRYHLLYNQLWVATEQRILAINKIFVSDNYLNFKHTKPDTVPSLLQLDKLLDSRSLDNSKQIPIHHPLAEDPTNVPDNITTEKLINSWDILIDQINICTKCNLCNTRKNVVIERGNRQAKWMFVGEAPSEEEDNQGIPFTSESGKLLDKMFIAMNLNKEQDVYVCNVVKCRPPSNLYPTASTILSCKNYLFSQINLVKPKIIVAFGNASKLLLNSNKGIGILRNKQHYLNKIPLIVTYDPENLRRDPSKKKETWEDLQLAMKIFGKEVDYENTN